MKKHLEWYCQFSNAEEGKTCKFRNSEKSEGVVLLTNAGAAGTWYFDDEIDLRPRAHYEWVNVEAYRCNACSSKQCPFSQLLLSDEEFAEMQREIEKDLQEIEERKRLDERKQEDELKKQWANTTVTYGGIVYQNSYELEVIRANGTDEEYLAALQKAKVLGIDEEYCRYFEIEKPEIATRP